MLSAFKSIFVVPKKALTSWHNDGHRFYNYDSKQPNVSVMSFIVIQHGVGYYANIFTII